MLSVYDLYDLHTILVNIRFFPENRVNKSVIKKVVDVLQGRYDSYDANKFRVALKEIDSLDKDELFAFAIVENIYCYFPFPFLKDQRGYTVLISACEQLLSAIYYKIKKKYMIWRIAYMICQL